MKKERIKNESFGLISFSRVQSTGTEFFGSQLTQNSYITLEIKNAELERSLVSDSYYESGSIIKLRLTSNQFAELITSMNRGKGIPCTLEFIQGKGVIPFEETESRKEFIQKKFKEKLNDTLEKTKANSKELKELLKKQRLNKDDKREIQWIIDKIIQEIGLNIPFYLECFQEDADNIVTEAKSEIESAILNRMTSLGMQKLIEINEQKKIFSQIESEDNRFIT